MTFHRTGLATLILGLAVGLASAAASPAAAAEPVADFYKSKRITFIISAGTGGGYSTYSRTFIRYMQPYIPGTPTVRPTHMQGAGGIVAANYLYNRAKRDGTVMAMIHRGAVSTVPLYGAKGIKYDPTKFSWIGSIDTSSSFCVAWHTAPVNNLEDMRKTTFIGGGLGPGANTDIFSHLLNNLFGTKIQLVTGYGSGDAINLAMERGEVQGRCSWSLGAIRATRARWLEEKKIKFLFLMGLKKHKELPNVPTIMDYVTTDRQKQIIELLLAANLMGRPILMPPAVPGDRLAALREAFDKTTRDKAFTDHMEKIGLGVSPLSGAEIKDLLRRIYATPKDVVAAAGEATKKSSKTKVTFKKIEEATVTTKLTDIKRGGRRLFFAVKGKTHKVKVSGSRTKVSIGGKKTKRKNLKVGMECTIIYKGNGSEAKSVACK
ncbi:MAG: tripartite tricarboxylate transporter substrate-binding protein [Alphaproteobacteria bacterium]|nr:tripartite tricarboxylate transporter substrate-binding protein [Alphaproteobacteria bacterium]